jgi:S-adenosyl-L-methionine hydrolase (adenosine-forming)
MAIITLTTDIGLQDYLVAAVKGQLYSVSEQLTIVDVSHQLSSFNYPQAAYFCCSAFRHFPKNTFHIVLVNMFDEKPKQMLLAYHNQQYIACADNGLLTMIVDGTPEYVVGLPLPEDENPTTLVCSKTIINAYKRMLAGAALQEVGNNDISIVEKLRLKYVTSPTTMEGQILYIDNFENVIVNITQQDFEKERNGRNFKIVFKRDEVIDSISDTYASVPQGEKVAFFNSAGYLEIAINKGNAAGLFGLQGFSEAMQKQSIALQNKWFYQTVKIFFE